MAQNIERDHKFLEWFYHHLNLGNQSITDLYKSIARSEYTAMMNAGVVQQRQYHQQTPQYKTRRDYLNQDQMDTFNKLKNYRATKKGSQLPDSILRKLIIERPTRENLTLIRNVNDTDVEKLYDEIMAIIEGVEEEPKRKVESKLKESKEDSRKGSGKEEVRKEVPKEMKRDGRTKKKVKEESDSE